MVEQKQTATFYILTEINQIYHYYIILFVILLVNRRRGKSAKGASAKGASAEGARAKGGQREPRGQRHDAASIRGMKNPAGRSIFQEYM